VREQQLVEWRSRERQRRVVQLDRGPRGRGHGAGDLRQSTAGPVQARPRWLAKAYPSIKVSYSDQDDNVSFAKYRAEHAQGARTADIIIASSPRQWDDNRDIALN
jgi:hypothetical protein